MVLDAPNVEREPMTSQKTRSRVLSTVQSSVVAGMSLLIAVTHAPQTSADEPPAATQSVDTAEKETERLRQKLTAVLEANFLEHQRVLMKWHAQEVTENELLKLKADLRAALDLPADEEILLTVPLRMDTTTSVAVLSRNNPFDVHVTFSKYTLDPVTNVRRKPALSDPSVPLNSICRHVLKLQEDEVMKNRATAIAMSSDESGSTVITIFDKEKMGKDAQNGAIGQIVFDEKTRKILQTVRY